MNLITLDFETYYDKAFSLSKMTTEAYIRDPRFEVIGVAVRVNGLRLIYAPRKCWTPCAWDVRR